MDSGNETKNFYNEIAKQSFKEWSDNPILLPTLSKFIQKLPKDPLVLDLGCGTGVETKRLIDLGARVIGIDFSEKSLEIAREHVPKAKFLNINILNLNFDADFFDGVVEAGVLFHFNAEEQNQILKHISLILKPKGIFLSYYPEGNFEGMERIDISGKSFQRYSRMVDIDTWVKQVKSNGFKNHTEYQFTLAPFRCVEFSK